MLRNNDKTESFRKMSGISGKCPEKSRFLPENVQNYSGKCPELTGKCPELTTKKIDTQLITMRPNYLENLSINFLKSARKRAHAREGRLRENDDRNPNPLKKRERGEGRKKRVGQTSLRARGAERKFKEFTSTFFQSITDKSRNNHTHRPQSQSLSLQRNQNNHHTNITTKKTNHVLAFPPCVPLHSSRSRHKRAAMPIPDVSGRPLRDPG